MTSPSSHDIVRARLEIVRRDLMEAVARLETVPLDTAPSDGMRTFRGQLEEIIATERQVLAWLTDQTELPFSEAATFEGDETLDALIDQLNATRNQTLTYLNSLAEADLSEPIHVPQHWFESLGLGIVPRREMITSIALHEWYHTAQLVSYLWARGDDPYSW